MDAVVARPSPLFRHPIALSVLVALLFFLLRYLVVYLKQRLHDTRHNRRHHHSRSHHSSRKDSAAKETKKSLPNVVLLLGIPGSGKTTWANRYRRSCNRSYTIVSAEEVRAKITGRNDDMSREEEVGEMVIETATRLLSEKHNVIIDDSSHPLKPEFRQRILSIGSSCNYLVKEFPLSPFFARTRLEKLVDQGIMRVIPTELQFEAMEASFNAARGDVKKEGWIQLLDSTNSSSGTSHRSSRS